jgi:diguanylate cyclase (GGDEF)-like protein
MDYGTLFFANIASMTVFAVCMILLAYYNRKIVGMSWFAGSVAVTLGKLVLQGLEGKISVVSGMVANELYLIAIVMQMIGLYWFVVRKPIWKSRWLWSALGVLLVIYSAMFLAKIQYGGNIINIPFVIICGISAWILLKHAHGPFAAVSRVTAIVVGAEMVVAAYRAVLTNLLYIRPWATVYAQTDPRWQYSLASMFFLATFMVMCEFWFLVTELQRELAEQARTDALTGALNRRALEEVALREASRSIRHGNPLCMIVMDIDEFKQINDARGHAAGDAVLRALVVQVKAMLRLNDLIARTGGEEFTILLPDTSVSAGIEAAERVRKAIETLEVPFETNPIRFTASLGVAQFDSIQGNWESMMRHADIAMYEAKENGRNKVAVGLAGAPVAKAGHQGMA